MWHVWYAAYGMWYGITLHVMTPTNPTAATPPRPPTTTTTRPPIYHTITPPHHHTTPHPIPVMSLSESVVVRDISLSLEDVVLLASLLRWNPNVKVIDLSNTALCGLGETWFFYNG